MKKIVLFFISKQSSRMNGLTDLFYKRKIIEEESSHHVTSENDSLLFTKKSTRSYTKMESEFQDPKWEGKIKPLFPQMIQIIAVCTATNKNCMGKKDTLIFLRP